MLARATPRPHAPSPAAEAADDVLTPPEAAALLKISERTLWNLTKAGKIPARRVGVQWRYSRLALLKARAVRVCPPGAVSAARGVRVGSFPYSDRHQRRCSMRTPRKPPERSRDGRRRGIAERCEKFAERCRRRRQLRFDFDKQRENAAT